MVPTLDFPVWLRVEHWLNVLFLTLLIRSGHEILASYPKLYWRNDSRPGTEWARFTRKTMPTDKLYDVAVHEWSHELSVLDYGGDVAAATRAMNATFGGSGLTGPERAADCMSILQGATWTHYTTCTNPAWRASAARLVAGKTLP